MQDGFEQRRKYDYDLHVQTLRVLRHVGYTVYCTTPKKKGERNMPLTKYLSLPFDDKHSEEIKPTSREDFEKMIELHENKFKTKK